MREDAEPREKPLESSNMQSKVVRFLSKSNRGKYAALARLVMRTFRLPAMPVRLSYGAWWLAGPGSLDERLLDGDFETAELKSVERYLRPGMVVFDIGAHYGRYSLLAAKCVGEKGWVRSFEPSPRERKYLKQNLGTVESFALGSSAERAELVLVKGTGDCCHSLRQPSVAVTSRKVPVERQTLDEYLQKQKVERVAFIKLDVEGGELGVLRGATRLLQSAERPIILAEVEDVRTAPWGYQAEVIIRHLESLGYRWWGLTDSGSLVPLDTKAESYDGNFVAWPEERLREMGTLADL